MKDTSVKLVLLHGALQSKASFSSVLESLESKFDVLALNLSGHGGREVPEELKTSAMAADVLAALDERGWSSAHFFGYSLGGYVALHLARHVPGRVRSVFAHATKLAWTPQAAEREAAGLDPRVLTERSPKFAAALERTHAGQDWTVLVSRFARLMVRLGHRPDLQDTDFRQIDVPVQLSVGDRDGLVTVEEVLEASRSVRHGRLLVLPGVPHPLASVPRERLEMEIESFVRHVEGAVARASF